MWAGWERLGEWWGRGFEPGVRSVPPGARKPSYTHHHQSLPSAGHTLYHRVILGGSSKAAGSASVRGLIPRRGSTKLLEASEALWQQEEPVKA